MKSSISYASNSMRQPINEELAQQELAIDTLHIPHHIAIIMDGNRRWAKKNNLPAIAGHWKGAQALTDLVSAAADLGVKVLTVYALSTENWRRSRSEVEGLIHLFESYLSQQRERMISDGVRLETIGDECRLPESLRRLIKKVKEETAGCQRIQLVVALNYGGRDDIRRAAISIAKDCLEGKLSKDSLSEEIFASYLDTARWKDPDLLIRTSGESRLSNFLLWQISYTEVYISEILWPDFEERELKKAILAFQKRDRRFGDS